MNFHNIKRVKFGKSTLTNPEYHFWNPQAIEQLQKLLDSFDMPERQVTAQGLINYLKYETI